jgi:phosphatidylserine/phosphatidylglycerophosphate/cardiolipin synthase-like enzyme
MSIIATFLEQDRQRPEQIAALLADFLSAAKSSLSIAVYDFRLQGRAADLVVGALRGRAEAGVAIRLVYDAGKPTAAPSPTRGDPAPPGTAVFVVGLGSAIVSKPITGGDPSQPKLMHHKYVVRDAGTPDAAVWTGSANWTDDSWSLQENNILRIDSRVLAGYYQNDFDELWQSGDIATTGLHDTGTVQVGAARVTVNFAPGQGDAIDHAIARYIQCASRRLKVGSMLLTSGPILRALADTAGQVGEYSGIYDRTQMEGVLAQWRDGPSNWKEPIFEQVAAPLVGKRSTPYTPGGRHDFMHNKILVIDDAVVTGSYNLSHSATQNAENCLVIHDPELADLYADYLDGLARRYGGNSSE